MYAEDAAEPARRSLSGRPMGRQLLQVRLLSRLASHKEADRWPL